MEADDGNFYVVKMLGNPQGSSILFRDALGSELMRLVGLPVPAWKPISISACLAGSSELRFQLPSGSTHAPARGPHFASLFIARDVSDLLYETLPTPWISRLVNQDHFIGALMVDLWTNNQDPRQAIFLKQGDSDHLYTFFIDQGYQFSNKSEHPKIAIRRVQFMNRGVYRCSGLETLLLEWEAKLAAITKDSLKQMVLDCNLPAPWYTSLELEKAIDLLIERQSLLSSFREAIQEDTSIPEMAGRSLRLYKNGNFDAIQIRGLGSCVGGAGGGAKALRIIGSANRAY